MEKNQRKKEEEEICAICNLSLNRTQDCTITSCKHDFHFSCLGKWTRKNNTCPICRSVILEKADENVSQLPDELYRMVYLSLIDSYQERIRQNEIKKREYLSNNLKILNNIKERHNFQINMIENDFDFSTLSNRIKRGYRCNVSKNLYKYMIDKGMVGCSYLHRNGKVCFGFPICDVETTHVSQYKCNLCKDRKTNPITNEINFG